jgi:pyruvate/2-oxoglutarate dehydrogenase complex dihydrolipoamide acyltransferase (E2) component
MRSSSVKTLVSAATLTFALVVAAPSAEARPSQPQRPSQSAPSMTDRAQRAVRQLLKRFGISVNEVTTVPIPRFAPGGSDQTCEVPSVPIPLIP